MSEAIVRTDPVVSAESTPDVPAVRWRIAGGMVLMHVLLFLVAAALSGPPTVHEGQQGIEHSFNDGDVGRLFAAGYVLAIGFLVLVPPLVLLGRELGGSSEVGRWAVLSGAAAGVAYVVLIVGVAFPAGAAALWAHHRDMDLPTVLAVNNIRNFAYYLALPVAGLFALGTGIGAVASGVLTRWVGWGGVVVGAALLVAIPVAATGVQYGMPLLLVWLLGVGLALLRHRPPGDRSAADRARAGRR